MWPLALESPPEIPARCPACPDLPGAYVTQWCAEHRPSTAGSADELVKVAAGEYINGGGEAGGDGNRAICAAIHRTGAAPR
jgi:hypothetical protein